VSLKEYRQKRNFAKSPEPQGDDALVRARRAGGTARYFCVQKHLATQLHYDLRLEHDGVLLSWAVPKGPSLDPTVKRLAMEVEDHPLEYGDFEGVIPEGYGAGVVMLWDCGTWTPESDDVDEALRKGDLKMTLDGYKLKGSWVLVRTRGWTGSRDRRADRAAADAGRSWLLIKHRDEWSGPLDITEFAPLSVKSEGDFADILGRKAPDVWTSNPGGSRSTGTAQALSKIVAKVHGLGEPRSRARPAPQARDARPGAPATRATGKAVGASGTTAGAGGKAGRPATARTRAKPKVPRRARGTTRPK
jgi:bifunctional non-homologous end joining protein LigD